MDSHINLREEYVWFTTLLNLTQLGFKGFLPSKNVAEPTYNMRQI